MEAGLDPDVDRVCQYVTCKNPMPSLTQDEYLVLLLFSRCRKQFVTDNGYKTGIRWSDVESACRGLGLVFNEYVMEKIDACIDACIEYDRSGGES